MLHKNKTSNTFNMAKSVDAMSHEKRNDITKTNMM